MEATTVRHRRSTPIKYRPRSPHQVQCVHFDRPQHNCTCNGEYSTKFAVSVVWSLLDLRTRKGRTYRQRDGQHYCILRPHKEGRIYICVANEEVSINVEITHR